MTSLFYYTDSGNTVHLGQQIGKGGEGVIYEINGDKKNVAKIYINQQTSEVHQKILAMVANPPHDPTINGPTKHHSMAWPSHVLYSDRQKLQFAGFIMPFIDTKNFQKILIYINAKDRKQMFYGSFTWLHLHVTARNLASCVAAIHEKGYCIGDLNESNILVQPATPLTIIDCDSFQVRDVNSGKIFRCAVGKPEYTAPEIIDCKYADIDRTHETECFALGVMIFQLLMEGFHPYQSRGKLVDNAPNTRDKIKLGIFPYNSGLQGTYPPEYAPSFDILAPEVRSLFIRCFDDGHKNPSIRPTAREWMSALDKLANKFITCKMNKNHRYLPHISSCPWCERLKVYGDNYHSFPDSTGIGMQFKLPDPTNNVMSKKERESFLLTFIEMALIDGIITPEEEAKIIEHGSALQISEKEVKKIIASEINKQGLPVKTTGNPFPRVDRSNIDFRDVKIGDVINETMEISNVGSGVLTGTITSNVQWIKVQSSMAPNMQNQSQKIPITIDTKNLSYGFSGTGAIAIKTNGGDTRVTIRLTMEGLSLLINKFRKSYVPLIAACAGFLGSLSSSPVSYFFFGALIFGAIAYASAELIVKYFLKEGIDIFKVPPAFIQGAAVAVLILAIMVHPGGNSAVRPSSYPLSPPVQASAPSTKPDTSAINITRAVVAAGADANNVAYGIDTSFPPGQKTLHYNVTYKGAIVNQTVFSFKWFKSGTLIKESQFTAKYPSGWVDNKLNHNFQPGQYEVQLLVDGRQLNGTTFNITEDLKAVEDDEMRRQAQEMAKQFKEQADEAKPEKPLAREEYKPQRRNDNIDQRHVNKRETVEKFDSSGL